MVVGSSDGNESYVSDRLVLDSYCLGLCNGYGLIFILPPTHEMCRFTFARTVPPVDDSQDIEMTSAMESDGATVIAFSRSFTASDSLDLPLNSSFVLWAYGSSSSPGSISYHEFNRGSITSPLPSSASLCFGKYMP